jgi:hypothetical protein
VIAFLTTLTAPAFAQKAEIDAVNAKWVEFFNKGDFAGVASLYTEDATAFPPGSSMVKGRPAIGNSGLLRPPALKFGDMGSQRRNERNEFFSRWLCLRFGIHRILESKSDSVVGKILPRPGQHHRSGSRYPDRCPQAGGLHHDPLRETIRHHHGGPGGIADRAGLPPRRRRAHGHQDRPAREKHWRPAKGASLKATEQPIDTSTAAGKCFLDMLGVFAEFETNPRRERQLEGIAKGKAAGVYKGRPASIDVTKVREMKAQGMGAS